MSGQITNYISLLEGDCATKLKAIKSDSISAIVTDPPYGLAREEWDADVPGITIWQECLRVLKPGAFAFVFSSVRSDLMASMIQNMEGAGFDMAFLPIFWTFASSFGKGNKVDGGTRMRGAYVSYHPKPAVQVAIVAMKPLAEPTYAEQAKSNGHGVTWLDDVRIPTGGEHSRFPSNLLAFDDSLNDGRVHKSGKIEEHHNPSSDHRGAYARFERGENVTYGDSGSFSRFFDADRWIAQFVVEGKPSPSERNAGIRTSREPLAEMCSAEGGMPYSSDPQNWSNDHATVKPIAMLSYLLTLGTRPNDLVLDPFAGTGTTGIACSLLKRHCIIIEKDHHNCILATQRIRYWQNHTLEKVEEIRKQEEMTSQTNMDTYT